MPVSDGERCLQVIVNVHEELLANRSVLIRDGLGLRSLVLILVLILIEIIVDKIGGFLCCVFRILFILHKVIKGPCSLPLSHFAFALPFSYILYVFNFYQKDIKWK